MLGGLDMRVFFFGLILVATGCVAAAPSDGSDDTFVTNGKTDTGGISEGSPEATGVLAVVDALSEDRLRSDVGLADEAASHIAAHGASFQSLAELDAVPYVGPIAFGKLLVYAKANGYVDGSTSGTPTVGTGTLLDCNTPVGPDQQVTVIGDGTNLRLRELTTSGGQVERALGLQEWAAHALKLRDDSGSQATLTKESGDWITRSFGGGDNELGNADCWVDKSP